MTGQVFVILATINFMKIRPAFQAFFFFTFLQRDEQNDFMVRLRMTSVPLVSFYLVKIPRLRYKDQPVNFVVRNNRFLL